jgi:hypothetical protein
LSLDWRRRESRRDDIHSKWAADVVLGNSPDDGFPDVYKGLFLGGFSPFFGCFECQMTHGSKSAHSLASCR